MDLDLDRNIKTVEAIKNRLLNQHKHLDRQISLNKYDADSVKEYKEEQSQINLKLTVIQNILQSEKAVREANKQFEDNIKHLVKTDDHYRTYFPEL